MSSWHEFGARHGFAAALESRGKDAVYAEVDLGRESLWCTDSDCRHPLERSIVGQMFQSAESLEQLWCRGRVEALILTGQVRRIAFCIGHGPHADRSAEANSALLNARLSEFDMTADVHPSSSGRLDDGDIDWREPLEVLSHAEVLAHSGPSVVLPPGRAPLEIGYTAPSRTLTHLVEEGAVWRWPYNSKHLWLLAAVAQNEYGWHIHPFALDFDPSQLLPSEATPSTTAPPA